MIKQIIKIPEQEGKIYQQVLGIMNFILGASEQERDVLAELVRLNNEYEALEPAKRAKFILSTDMRKEIRENLGMKEQQFNTLISRLKNKDLFGKKFIDKKGLLNPNLLFKVDKEGYELIVRIEKNTKKQKVFTNAIPEKENNIPKKTQKTEISETVKKAQPANKAEVVEDPYQGQINIL